MHYLNRSVRPLSNEEIQWMSPTLAQIPLNNSSLSAWFCNFSTRTESITKNKADPLIPIMLNGEHLPYDERRSRDPTSGFACRLIVYKRLSEIAAYVELVPHTTAIQANKHISIGGVDQRLQAEFKYYNLKRMGQVVVRIRRPAVVEAGSTPIYEVSGENTMGSRRPSPSRRSSEYRPGTDLRARSPANLLPTTPATPGRPSSNTLLRNSGSSRTSSPISSGARPRPGSMENVPTAIYSLDDHGNPVPTPRSRPNERRAWTSCSPQ